MRDPHQGCTSRWASTGAAALWAPSLRYAFAAIRDRVDRDAELGRDVLVRLVATYPIEDQAFARGERALGPLPNVFSPHQR